VNTTHLHYKEFVKVVFVHITLYYENHTTGLSGPNCDIFIIKAGDTNNIQCHLTVSAFEIIAVTTCYCSYSQEHI
jgi:hypothetical protein